jgi:hypothetical protein
MYRTTGSSQENLKDREGAKNSKRPSFSPTLFAVQAEQVRYFFFDAGLGLGRSRNPG